ncbi:MAG: cell division protein FtsL [Firmicutes bacterium]|jgi:cell division protein FtsL|nr:cell division protein FtsL [Bacillota bacterium]MDD4336877.1 cell division protein FtsL [Bacillota bacterium]MDD4792568.1 cell division protein FtsL [Bacillota bacterium]
MECTTARIGDAGRESVRRRNTRSFRLMAQCGIIAVLAIVLLVTFVAQRAEMIRAYDHRTAAKARLVSLQNESDRISLELAKVASLERVEAVARTELGMVSPANMGIVVVDARPMLASTEAAQANTQTQALSEPPTVLASAATVLKGMAIAAASNLIAGWFAAPQAQLPSVLK